MKTNPKIKRRLDDILLYSTEIADMIDDITFMVFKDDTRTLRAVERNLSVIREAVRAIEENTPGFFSQFGINSKEIIGMRNILAHDYIRIEADEIWNVAIVDLPVLKEKIERAIAQS